MTFGSLFAGIGGIDLGLERAGLECRWQVENDKYAIKVLEKHWPNVRRHDDVRTFPPGEPDEWRVDLIAGGFPCQDVSNAGKRQGIDGERSGLWTEFARVIRVLRPLYVLVENVPGLFVRGFDRVLGSLAEMGFDAEWGVFPAAAFGAPHIRERVFVLAYPQRGRRLGADHDQRQHAQARRDGRVDPNDDGIAGEASRESTVLADAQRDGLEMPINAERGQGTAGSERRSTDANSSNVPDSSEHGREPRWKSDASQEPRRREPDRGGLVPDVPHAIVIQQRQLRRQQFSRFCEEARRLYQWESESPVCGVADGVPARTHRLRVLGNAVVPVVAEYIGRCLIEFDSNHREFEP